MRVRNEAQFQHRKEELMEKCFDCYAEHGFGSVGIKGLAFDSSLIQQWLNEDVLYNAKELNQINGCRYCTLQ